MMYQNEPRFEREIYFREWNRDIVEISSSKWLTKWWMKLERQIWNGTGRQAYTLARGDETLLCS